MPQEGVQLCWTLFLWADRMGAIIGSARRFAFACLPFEAQGEQEACATGKGRRRSKAAPTMSIVVREYGEKDFGRLHRLDQECFPPGISYSKWSLHYYLSLPGADCLVAEEGKTLAGFILAEENPPLGHIITLDVAEAFRRRGVGTMLLREMEEHFAFRGVEAVLLETSVENKSGIAFWEKHEYRTEAVVKKYYLGKIDAFEMRKRIGKSK